MCNFLNYLDYKKPARSWQQKVTFAWRLANVISECLKLPFLNPVLESDKPQMKQLSIQEKIKAWSKIYESNQEIIDSDITGKSIIVLSVYAVVCVKCDETE